MVLSHLDIEGCIDNGDISIDPYDPRKLEPASYDISVGKEAATQKGLIDIEKNGVVSVPRGAIVVIKPLEIIKLSGKVVARYGLRSKFARKGLVLLSGPQIKPGWRGALSITIFNAGSSSVELCYEERFAEIEFSKLDEPATKAYSGSNQDQSLKLSSDEIELAVKEYCNLRDLEKKQHRVEANQNIVMNFIYVVVFGIVSAGFLSFTGQKSFDKQSLYGFLSCNYNMPVWLLFLITVVAILLLFKFCVCPLKNWVLRKWRCSQ